jgi:mRNA interferase RelE/StbE
VVKSLRRLPRPERERLLNAIADLPSGDVRPLHGLPDGWRLRVGDWRVRFRRDDAERVIDVVLVAARGSAYKR